MLLAYVIRKEQVVQAPVDDLLDNYKSKQDEMVGRALHTDINDRLLDLFKNDRRKVYEILLAMTDGDPLHVYIKRAQMLESSYYHPFRAARGDKTRGTKQASAPELVYQIMV